MGKVGISPKIKWTVEKIEKIQEIMANVKTISLDTPLSTGDGGGVTDFATVADLLEDQGPNPEELAIQNENKDIMIRSIHNALGAREAKIILLRFGFEGPPKTLEEIGEIYGVTRERIRQVEEKALIKMRRYIEQDEKFQRTDFYMG